MTRGWPRLLPAVLIISAGLAGCSMGASAYDVDRADLVGTWYADLGTVPRAELILSEDGSVRASEWPETMYCKGEAANKHQLESAPRVELSGEWNLDSRQTNAYVGVSFDAAHCTSGGNIGLVWRDGTGLQICMAIPPRLDPDSQELETTLVLRQDGADAESTSGCGY